MEESCWTVRSGVKRRLELPEMDIEALARLIEPEDEGVCLRYILKYSTRGGSNILQLFETSEKKDHLMANRRRWLEHPRERVAMQDRLPNESGMTLSSKEEWQKPCRALKVLLESRCHIKVRRQPEKKKAVGY